LFVPLPSTALPLLPFVYGYALPTPLPLLPLTLPLPLLPPRHVLTGYRLCRLTDYGYRGGFTVPVDLRLPFLRLYRLPGYVALPFRSLLYSLYLPRSTHRYRSLRSFCHALRSAMRSTHTVPLNVHRFTCVADYRSYLPFTLFTVTHTTTIVPDY